MTKQKIIYKSERELQEAILEEKRKGIPDLEIGKKYGVNFKYIERLITRSQGLNISNLKIYKKINSLYPKDFREEKTTVWSFKQRGNWATHSGEYRGNWSPYIPRNVILKYSKPGELVLDYFCGAGTTAVESQQLTFNDEETHPQIYEPQVLISDARDLYIIEDNSIDLICALPPNAGIINYSSKVEGGLS
ncbi:MAG TPA: hypothetical protein DEG96_06430 [Candidatus Atribacteria bacterium]|nr:hypothetical protein [Candidatus Atribacteria bacterium]